MKRTFVVFNIILMLLFLTSLPPAAKAGTATAVINGAKDTISFIANKFGKDAIEKEGGELVVKTGAENAIEKYGDSVIPIMKNLGPSAVTIINKHGEDSIYILNKWETEGLILLKRSGDSVIPFYKEYGDEAIQICINHPVVGEKLIQNYGAKGIKLGKSLSTDEIIKMVRWAPELKEKGQLDNFADLVNQKGSTVFDKINELIKNNKTFLTGAGAVLYVLDNPEILEAAGSAVGNIAEKGLKGAGEGIGEGISKPLETTIKEGLGTPLIIAASLSFIICVCFWLYLKHLIAKAKAKIKN